MKKLNKILACALMLIAVLSTMLILSACDVKYDKDIGVHYCDKAEVYMDINNVGALVIKSVDNEEQEYKLIHTDIGPMFIVCSEGRYATADNIELVRRDECKYADKNVDEKYTYAVEADYRVLLYIEINKP